MNRILKILIVASGVLIIDQVTKAIVLDQLYLHERVAVVTGFLDFTYVQNPGMAFGLLRDVKTPWMRWGLSGLAVVAVTIIWTYARQGASNTTVAVAFGAILGGALGNLLDRLRLGYVVDFVLVHWDGWQWPAFNVADTAITMGGIGLFLTLSGKRTIQEMDIETTGSSPRENGIDSPPLSDAVENKTAEGD